MNRIITGIGILLLLIVLGVGSLWMLRHHTQQFAAYTQTVAEEFSAADTEKTLEAYDRLSEEWEQFHDIAGVFVNGKKLDDIHRSLAGLGQMIAEEHPDVLTELARIKELTETLFREELPDLWHIL